MNAKVNLIYFSATGTTAKIIKEVSKGITNIVNECNITLPSKRQEDLVFDYNDLVIVGVPVYAGRVPGFLADYFSKIKGNNTKAVFIVVYGNRDFDDALLELKDIFEKNGFIGIAGGAFIGEHSYSSKLGTCRPDNADLNKSLDFGVKIKEKLATLEGLSKIPELKVKGNFPYKEKRPAQQIAPETSSNCIECGICSKHCPMEAISFDNYKDIDHSKCIKCCRCIKGCPVEAKAITDEALISFTQNLIDNFSKVRHEPEIFIP